MCDPSGGALTVAALTIAAVGSAASVYQSYEASQQANAMFKQNQRNSIKALRDSYDTQAVAANQRRDAAGQSATQNAIDAARARATASAAASGSNIGGLSVDALMNEITRQESSNYQNIAVNETYAEEQRQREALGLTNQAQSRINSAARGNFNPIIGLLQIGGATAGAYAQQNAAQERALKGGT